MTTQRQVSVLIASLALLSACTPQRQDHAASGSSATGGSPSAHAPVPPATNAGATAKVASASGVIEAIDPAAATVTIAHGPVEALQWPAMTMTFDAPGIDLGAFRRGNPVSFEFTSTGMNGTITGLRLD